MVRAILFDLDGTLLDLELSAFLGRYFAALESAAAPLEAASTSSRPFMRDLHDATSRMMEPHPGITNQQAFNEHIYEATGIDLTTHAPIFDEFYARVFPTLGGSAGPVEGAREAVTSARRLGLKTAVATNPIFPRVAVEHRIRWAGLGDVEFDAITTYETMHATKPHADYYRQTAEILGVDTHECLMVGDDRSLDLPAADVGMRTFYVGQDTDTPADWSGSLADLTLLLPALTGSSDALWL